MLNNSNKTFPSIVGWNKNQGLFLQKKKKKKIQVRKSGILKHFRSSLNPMKNVFLNR